MKMKFLVVGAGALGGYFGGRLLEADQDVTFLLRPKRAAQLASGGLLIRSPHGDSALPSPPSVQKEQLTQPSEQPFDVIIVGCKAYDLTETMDSFAPAVGPDTVILPLLNGLRHLDILSARFGRQRVLGGLCLISAALDDAGTVQHLNDTHTLVFGELDSGRSARVDAIAAAFATANFDGPASDNVLHAMWEKWVLIASLAGITTLMRASVGDIIEAGAGALSLELLDECSRIARHNGFAPGQVALDRARTVLSTVGSPITASMFKDIERGARTEADHVIGDLLRRAPVGATAEGLLRVAYGNLCSYEVRRARSP